jgi:WD40 repeat protein
MNDIDTTKLHGALRALAEAGAAPDESAAWEAISLGIEADARRARRVKLLVSAGAALTAAAAVAALVLLGPIDRDQAIDVGPAGPGSTVTTPVEDSTDHTSVGEPITLPPATVVATGADGTQLHVLDARTGERVSTPIVLDGGDWVVDAAITRDGTIFYAVANLQTGSSETRRTTWDAAGDSAPVDALPAFARELTLNPGETRLAFGLGSSGLDGGPSRIGFYDLTNGEVGYLDWRDDEDPDRRTGGIGDIGFSPDGTQLVFSASQDSFDPIESFVVDVGADSLSDARSLGLQVGSVHWMPDGSIIGVRDLEIGSSRPLGYIEGGPDVGLPSYEGQLDGPVVTGAAGLLIRTVDPDTGTFHFLRLDDERDRWVTVDAFADFADVLLAASP